MTKTIKRIALLLSLFIIIVFAVFLYNQTAQVVYSARAFNRTFGDGVMWGLLFLYFTLLVTPIVLWLKVPKRMALPTVSEVRNTSVS